MPGGGERYGLKPPARSEATPAMLGSGGRVGVWRGGLESSDDGGEVRGSEFTATATMASAAEWQRARAKRGMSLYSR
jgi:hypothetical protein